MFYLLLGDKWYLNHSSPALAHGLSPVQVDNHGITILYHLLIGVHLDWYKTG